MKQKTYNQILLLIEQIELTDKLLSNLKEVNEPLDKSLFSEMQRKKRNLIKKLLTQMIELGLGFRQFESLYQKIFSFLKLSEKETEFPLDFQKNMAKAEQFLVTN